MEDLHNHFNIDYLRKILNLAKESGNTNSI